MYTGSVTLNGLTDQDLVKVFEIKIKYEKALYFNPQQMQQQNIPQGGQTYNNAVFNWSDQKGLEAVHRIISILLKKDEKVAGVAG